MTEPDVEIVIKPFAELSLRELHACLKLRGEVFVVGQQICAVPDVDEHDPEAYHVMAWRGDELVGTARLLIKDDGRAVKVGRVAVAAAQRGRGHGGTMMRAIQAWIGTVPGRGGVMSAQAYLEGWYGGLGWQREGDIYMEAGIEHLAMCYPPASDA